MSSWIYKQRSIKPQTWLLVAPSTTKNILACIADRLGVSNNQLTTLTAVITNYGGGDIDDIGTSHFLSQPAVVPGLVPEQVKLRKFATTCSVPLVKATLMGSSSVILVDLRRSSDLLLFLCRRRRTRSWHSSDWRFNRYSDCSVNKHNLEIILQINQYCCDI